jgi:glycine/D-amino acid oxidase-like deaminating enzyme
LHNFEIRHSWAQIRTTTRDRYPIVGSVPHQNNLYVIGALGSHGLQFGLLLGEVLACQITHAPLPVGRDAANTFTINRFWKTS